MSDFRDRIAAAITGIRIQRDGDSYQMADAVIEALGLKRVNRYAVGKQYHHYETEWVTEVLSLDQTFELHEKGCVCDDCLPDDID